MPHRGKQLAAGDATAYLDQSQISMPTQGPNGVFVAWRA
jgi:hypothetical protein